MTDAFVSIVKAAIRKYRISSLRIWLLKFSYNHLEVSRFNDGQSHTVFNRLYYLQNILALCPLLLLLIVGKESLLTVMI